MTEDTTLISLNAFISSRTKIIRNEKVLHDTDIAELFETDILHIRYLTEANPESFMNDAVLLLRDDERSAFPETKYAYTHSGIFTLAGLIRSKRAIGIYVRLIELLVNNLQDRAYEIATSCQIDNQ